MKTQGVFYVGENQVALREFEIGDPDLYEVQIEVKATGLCAWDLSLYQGHLHAGVSFPFLHGHEGAGVITKVGQRVKGYKEGDKVTAMGDYSALMGHVANVSEKQVAKLTDDVTHYEHWIAEPVACVMNGLEWCHLVPGDRIAVIGAGFMGLLFLQALPHALVSEIIAIDVDAHRLALAKQFGADRIINVSTPEGLAEANAIAQNPVDVAVECAGNQAAFDMSYRIVRKQGRVNVFSAQRGAPRTVDLSMWHGKGVQVYASSPSISPDFARVWARTVPMMQRGIFDLRPLVTHLAPPTDAAALFRTAVSKADEYIKGVIVW